MRIACLQFAPQVGDVSNNLNRADAVLSKAIPKDLDLLVLPELAFSGYNFRSLQHISPYLEPTTAGITSLWARTTALKHGCTVIAGYPEKVDVSFKWPAGPEYYNSAIVVNADGETIANYRKTFLYYTDEKWALEGQGGFYDGEVKGLGNIALGICMDLNPYKFEAPWNSFEFAYHVLHSEANIVILSMAWLTREDARSYSRVPREPDMETLSYWLGRLEPIIRAETKGEIIVVFANRCGIEDDAVYAGTSAVLGIHDGEVKVYGILGRGEKELLVVDTLRNPQAKLISEPNSETSTVTTATTNSDASVLSVSTAATSPGLDTSLGDFAESCDDYYVSPVSPRDTRFPQSYFRSKEPVTGEVDLGKALKSSIFRPGFDTPSPLSPSFQRPESPKSRNASRNRQRHEEEPALASHDLAQEPQVTRKSLIKPPPHSASAVPDSFQLSYRSNSLGPRSRHVSPRPRSTLW